MLHYILLHYGTQHDTTLHCITLRYYTTPQLQLHQQLHYANYNTLQLQLHYTILQLQLQRRYTTLHTAVVGEATTATIATTLRNTTPTTFRSISGFAQPSMHHNNSPPISVLSLKLTPPPCAVMVVVVVGGDQVAESIASVTKGQLGQHGLSRNASDRFESRHVLAVHYLNKLQDPCLCWEFWPALVCGT